MAVKLSKGQKINLEKSDGSSLSKVIMGLGWDAAKKEIKQVKSFWKLLFNGKNKEEDDDNSIDLDASCFIFDKKQKLVDIVWFNQLESNDGSIIHTGDNRTGDGENGEDDEQIIVNLKTIPAEITNLVFTIHNASGQNFSEIENAYCRLVDMNNKQEIARYDLSAQTGNYNAQIMARLYKQNGAWKMQALGENTRGTTFNRLEEAIRPLLV